MPAPNPAPPARGLSKETRRAACLRRRRPAVILALRLRCKRPSRCGDVDIRLASPSAFLDSLLRDKNLSLRMREDIKKGMATGEDWAAQLRRVIAVLKLGRQASRPLLASIHPSSTHRSTRKASHVAATSARPRPRGQPSRRRTTALPAEGASLAAMPARTGECARIVGLSRHFESP